MRSRSLRGFFTIAKASRDGRGVDAHYVYALHLNADDKVDNMIKVWHSQHTMVAFGWA